MSSCHTKSMHPGYTPAELASSLYERLLKADVPLLVGAQPCESFPGVEQTHQLRACGYWPLETGYGLGSARLDLTVHFVPPAFYQEFGPQKH